MKTNLLAQLGAPPKLNGFVYAYHPATPGSNPKHTIYVFIIFVVKFVLYLSCEKKEIKQIEARLGPFKKPLLNNLIFPHARSYSLSHSSIPHSIFHSFSASFFASFLPHIFIFLSLPSILINLNLLIDVRKARRQGNLGFSTLSTQLILNPCTFPE